MCFKSTGLALLWRICVPHTFTTCLDNRRWAYEQAVESLIKVYKDAEGRAAQGCMYGTRGAACPGALAEALKLLAEGLRHAKPELR